MKTYRGEVTATALRSIKVRAYTAADALAMAQDRIKSVARPWTIDFPGSMEEHYAVYAGEKWLGLDAGDNMLLEQEED